MLSPDAKTLPTHGTPSAVQLGLRANWQQFTLLVIVNAFVGAMVGLERSIVPLLGHQMFGLASTTAVGVYRLWRDSGYAIGALLAGVLADLFGISWAIGVIAGVTFLSGVVAQGVMRETLPRTHVATIPTL